MSTEFALLTAATALVFGLVAGVSLFVLIARHKAPHKPAAWPLAVCRAAWEVQLTGGLLALLGLAWAFLVSDFTVLAVAEWSNTALPWAWRADAVFAAAGATALMASAAWTGMALALLRRGTPQAQIAAGVTGLSATVLLGWAMTGASLFARQEVAPIEGKGMAIAQQAAVADALNAASFFSMAIVPASLQAVLTVGLAATTWWLVVQWLVGRPQVSGELPQPSLAPQAPNAVPNPLA